MPRRDDVPLPRLNAEPNVTPAIDVLLVLLIIFMVGLMLQQQHMIAAQLPRETAGEGDAAIVLEVLADGRYAINQDTVSPAEAGVRLRAIYAGRPDKVLFVRGAPRTRWQAVVTAMDSARGAGVTALGISPKRLGP
jgi:biopolymer transport protein TolR